MKCETPAFASVSSREPAPIQKPIATERTLGTRSEITRSPESSSDRTYFCTAALSWPGAMAAYRFLTTWLLEAPREHGLGRDLRRGALARVVARRRADRGHRRPALALVVALVAALHPRVRVRDPPLRAPEHTRGTRDRGDLAGDGLWRVYEGELGTASTWEWQVETTRALAERLRLAGEAGSRLEPPSDHALGRRGPCSAPGARFLAAD